MSLAEYIRCGHCGDEVTPDSEFCPHCGSLFSVSEEVQCDHHPGSEAEGICIICRTLCCHLCGKEIRGKFFCSTHKGVEVQQDWACAFISSEISESSLVEALLESNGFKVLVQNFGSAGYVWEGGGDSPLSRSAIGKQGKVFVPIPEYLKAEKTIQEWRSGAARTEE